MCIMQKAQSKCNSMYVQHKLDLHVEINSCRYRIVRAAGHLCTYILETEHIVCINAKGKCLGRLI